jgi:ribosomal protein S18 acetylase RimI-like enzyme
MDRPPNVTFRLLTAQDGAGLCGFYNGLSDASRRTFRPLGLITTIEACSTIFPANVRQEKHDLLAVHGEKIIGWGFIWDLHKAEPVFGLAVADAFHGRGLGTELTRRVLAEADRGGLPRVVLTVVKDNHRARHLYERAGFREYGQYHDDGDGLDYYRMERLAPVAARPAV